MTVHPTAPLGALLALGGAILILVTRQGTLPGALAGFAVALLAALGLGAGALLPLAIFVLGSGLLTRVGRGRKEQLGAAEGNRGRRGPAHVAAKLSLPALAATLAILGLAPLPALTLVYVASLAGAFADTAATEIGPLFGGPVLKFRGGRLEAIPHGTPGGMSLAGFKVAGLASLAVALGALAVGLLGTNGAIACVTVAGFLACVLESLLAGTALGARAGHFGRNVFLSLASAGLALSARALGWTGS
jgi:uncharacterized protein (TIGR00297 family)